MSEPILFTIIIGITVIAFGVVLTFGINQAIKTHKSHQLWGSDNDSVPPMFDKMLEKAMSARDQEISNLKERIEVLEKIITDQHQSNSLADEIETLRR